MNDYALGSGVSKGAGAGRGSDRPADETALGYDKHALLRPEPQRKLPPRLPEGLKTEQKELPAAGISGGWEYFLCACIAGLHSKCERPKSAKDAASASAGTQATIA